MNKRHFSFYIAGFVAIVTLAIYQSAIRSDFVIWDDDVFIINNYHIRSLDPAFFKWAFSDISLDFWHPVTWISEAIDYALWGLNPAGYHLTNILLHAANTFIVVLLAIRLFEAANMAINPSAVTPPVSFPHDPTRPPLKIRGGEGGVISEGGKGSYNNRAILISAGITGLLFGLHPVHVESAAWVSGRTDLLCALFFLLSIMAYMQMKRDYRQYLLSLVFFALALLSKPLAVVLPAVLLILDWYPLRRTPSLKSFWKACIEKLPFIAMSLFVSVFIYWGEKAHGRMARPDEVSFASRVPVAFKALMMYLRQIMAPLNLLPFHPYPEKVSFLSIEYLSAIVLAGLITAACMLMVKRQKVLLAVWGYYLITLLPVIGIIKVRTVYMADRDMYLPSLGPFLLIGSGAAWIWEKADSLKQWTPVLKRFTVVLALSLCISLSYLTLKQIAVWKNGITLWNSVIEKEPYRIATAYLNRGLAFREIGQPERALEDINTAITLDTTQSYAPMAYTDRGIVYKETGQIDRAIEDYNRAITLDPKYADAYANRGIAFNETGQFSQAVQDFDRAVALDPSQYLSYIGRGAAFREMGQANRAIEDYTQALTLNPGYADAYTNRGIVFKETGQFNRAIEDYNAAIRLNPSSVEAYNDRGVAYKHLGQLDRALADYDRAIGLNPSFNLAYMNRGMVLASIGRVEEATRDYQKACNLGSRAGCDALLNYRKR